MHPLLTLSEIWIYPVKSLAGIRLESAQVYRKGLQFDRRWMLIDSDGVAMTQRTYPEMALFKVHIDDGEVSIDYTKANNNSSTAFRISATSGNVKVARIWNDDVNVLEVDPRISEWFSLHLQKNCRLVLFPEENPRPVDPRYSVSNDHVSLADAYPFLVIGQSSLDDLNQRLSSPVPMNRFRPNFVFTGGNAYLEDQFRDFSIGNIRFVGVKNCARCALPTVNQDTAERGVEPLRTLTAYRKVDHKVLFGRNLVALNEGKISVGQPLIPG
ncbi:MAG TPA: MOSC N-terminal beta barrel domain-containing protein [Chryseosolibacter sp.]|nr:MOSC N-terminal beta barrel domain-containing protein [Chryseosolibacter sp.]